MQVEVVSSEISIHPEWADLRQRGELQRAAPCGIAREVGGEEVRVCLLGEGVAVAKSGRSVPKGYCNLERMLAVIASRGAEIGACGTRMDARGLTEPELVDGVRRSTL